MAEIKLYTNSYLLGLNGGDLNKYRFRTTPEGQPKLNEVVKRGDIVITNYDTGPYKVVKVSGPYTHHTGLGWEFTLPESYTILCCKPEDKFPLPKNYQHYYLNELVFIDGRILHLFENNSDEVMIIEKSNNVIPDFSNAIQLSIF
ncbi:MAG: hypothetical protein GXX85_00875 [Ignavibacteria bacterium]|nr:hypothetical protein [Ignavibacteria bacterium]